MQFGARVRLQNLTDKLFFNGDFKHLLSDMHSEQHLLVILGSARFVSTVVLWVEGGEGSFVL